MRYLGFSCYRAWALECTDLGIQSVPHQLQTGNIWGWGEITENSKKKKNMNLCVPATTDMHVCCIKYFRDDLKYIGGCEQVICKYHTLLYKLIEHPSILLSMGVQEPIPHGY